MERDRTPDGLREELEGPDEAGHTTARTGAGGEAARNDDPAASEQSLRTQQDETPLDSEEAVIAGPHSGGSPPGAILPPPDADWPDPLGGDDEQRELERRTR